MDAAPAPDRWKRRSLVLIGAAGLGGLALLAAIAWHASSASSPFSTDPVVLARGAAIYAARCASCHGAELEGQPDWQSPRPGGRMPAPPHNSDGHTWHHDSASLFGITKQGLVPPWAPPGYKSDMPAFAGVLSDEEIWAVLAFIASTWSEEAKAWQHQIEVQARR